MAKKAARPNRKQAASNSIVIPDGSVNVVIGDQQYKLDLLQLKMTCEEVEDVHPMRQDGEMVIPTAAFLSALSEAIKALGVTNCTPTAAWVIWQKANEHLNELKKNL